MQSDGRPLGRIDFDALVPVMQKFENSNIGIRGVVQRYERLRDRFHKSPKNVGKRGNGGEIVLRQPVMGPVRGMGRKDREPEKGSESGGNEEAEVLRGDRAHGMVVCERDRGLKEKVCERKQENQARGSTEDDFTKVDEVDPYWEWA